MFSLNLGGPITGIDTGYLLLNSLTKEIKDIVIST